MQATEKQLNILLIIGEVKCTAPGHVVKQVGELRSELRPFFPHVVPRFATERGVT